MSYFVTTYPQGTFCWADVSSTDIGATKKFMEGLFGWTSKDLPMPQGGDYTTFFLQEKRVAGGSQMPTSMAGVPSMWNNYVKVDDVDSMVKKAEQLGAKVVMPAMDVMDVGRMAAIQDPTDAYLMLWQPKTHIGAGIVNTIGAMGWNELYTKDVEKAKDFYGKLFGWTFKMMPEMDNYTVIQNNGRGNGGMLTISPEMGPIPPHWLVYFSVENADETAKKVETLGGKVLMDVKDIQIGKIAVIADPAGAAFMIMQSYTPAEEWKE